MKSTEYIVFGAGRLGRRVAKLLNPIAYCDNNPKLWGVMLEGILVLSPTEAVRLHPGATFVVCIWHPTVDEHMFHRVDQLRRLGADEVIPFMSLFDDHTDLLPNFLWERRSYFEDHKEQIAAAQELLDSEGRQIFAEQVRLRFGDLTPLRLAGGDQYFPSGLIKLSDKEVFIDCGAYNGDTITDFLHASNGNFERIIAFEPDPENCKQLQNTVARDPRIIVYPYATGAKRETLCFAADGAASHLTDSGGIFVQCVALDEVLSEIGATYIKMDIEGSELDTLEGARNIIEKNRPKLAVCVYHEPDHLWRIPMRLHELQPDARLTMRSHRSDGFDCVCYSLPGQ